MDPVGLIDRILQASYTIDFGRKNLSTPGKEGEGRLAYESGISKALSAFRDARATKDAHILILVDYAYVRQELQFCDPSDKDTLSSLNTASQSFDDALNSLEVIKVPSVYKEASKTYSTIPKRRIQGCPLDVFHQSCTAHTTRLRNSLRTPGVNMIEKAVTHQRIANMRTAQESYLKLQLTALLETP